MKNNIRVIFLLLLWAASSVSLIMTENQMNNFFINYQLRNEDTTSLGSDWILPDSVRESDYHYLNLFEYHKIITKIIISGLLWVISFMSLIIEIKDNNHKSKVEHSKT